MPSGHGGGGSSGSHGSSFGGGGSHSSSFGGSHSSSGYSSHSHYRGGSYYRGGYYYGGGYYDGDSRPSIAPYILAIIFINIFCILMAVSLFIGASNQTHKLSVFEQDRATYIQLINDAESAGRIVEGEITSIKFNEDFGKWYIEYKFTTKVDGYIIHGYSYSVYKTRMDANPNGNMKVRIAYDAELKAADSMPVDYLNFSLKDDGEYATAKSGITTNIVIGIVALVIDAGLTVLFIFLAIKKAKRIKEEFQANLEATKAQTAAANKVDPQYIKVTCKYCNTKYASTKEKCPHCGASTNKSE